MAIEIKDWFSSDIDEIWNWTPPDPYNVYFGLELGIGPKCEEAADIFQIVVATPQGLDGMTRQSTNIIEDRGILIVERYERSEVFDHLESIVAKCASATWVESTLKLQRYFHWEYEDYVQG